MGITIKGNMVMDQKVDSYSNLSHTGTIDLKTGRVILVTNDFMTEEYSKKKDSKAFDQSEVHVILEGKDLQDIKDIFYKLLHKSDKFKEGVKSE